jgi:hypothetical protein
MAWLKRIRGALVVGLTWAFGWAAFGLLIGVSSLLLPGLPWDAFFAVFDAPLPALGVPGFVGGVLFAVVLRVAAHRRRLDELSLRQFGAWGALGGLLLSLVPGTMTVVGLATVNEGALGFWPLTAVIAGPLTLLSAASAVGSLLIARRGLDPALPDADRSPGDTHPRAIRSASPREYTESTADASAPHIHEHRPP